MGECFLGKNCPMCNEARNASVYDAVEAAEDSGALQSAVSNFRNEAHRIFDRDLVRKWMDYSDQIQAIRDMMKGGKNGTTKEAHQAQEEKEKARTPTAETET